MDPISLITDMIVLAIIVAILYVIYRAVWTLTHPADDVKKLIPNF